MDVHRVTVPEMQAATAFGNGKAGKMFSLRAREGETVGTTRQDAQDVGIELGNGPCRRGLGAGPTEIILAQRSAHRIICSLVTGTASGKSRQCADRHIVMIAPAIPCP